MTRSFRYDVSASKPKVICPVEQRVNITYDTESGAARAAMRGNLTDYAYGDHLVNPTIDPGPQADQPFTVQDD